MPLPPLPEFSMEERGFSQFTVVCTTDDCENRGHELVVWADPTATPEGPMVFCGPCGSVLPAVPVEE